MHWKMFTDSNLELKEKTYQINSKIADVNPLLSITHAKVWDWQHWLNKSYLQGKQILRIKLTKRFQVEGDQKVLRYDGSNQNRVRVYLIILNNDISTQTLLLETKKDIL